MTEPTPDRAWAASMLTLWQHQDEQRGADRMARAMVAALYWRAGELWATGLVVEILAAHTIARAAQRLEVCL